MFKKGSVSLFMVVFSTLLVTIIGISFTRIMLKEYQRAVDSDLNQSAYDSALAGVEDAKRALLKYTQKICAQSDRRDCNKLLPLLDGSDCDVVHKIFHGDAPVDGETLIKSSDGADSDLEQAYTCVKINYYTSDYKRDLNAGEKAIIPLRAKEKIDKIRFSWFSKTVDYKDLSLNLNGLGNSLTFPGRLEEGSDVTPPVIELQHLKYLKDETNAKGVLFLRPSDGSDGETEIKRVIKNQTAPIKRVKCKSEGTDGYACSETIKLLETIPRNDDQNFIRVNPIYKGTSFKIEFINNKDKVIEMNGIQPEIDSNGRANDIYRRVKARVEFIDDHSIQPDAGVVVIDDVKKNFQISHEIYSDLDKKP